MLFFFFKQKTAYEMRISDWSSDVCSSDLARRQLRQRDGTVKRILVFFGGSDTMNQTPKAVEAIKQLKRPDIAVDVVVGGAYQDRKSVVEGKSVSVRVDLGGRRSMKKQKKEEKSKKIDKKKIIR